MRLNVAMLMLALSASGCRNKPGTAQAPPPAAAPDAEGRLKGRVAERIDAPPYSYLRLTVGRGEAWAAVPQATLAAGAEVVVIGAAPMENFESKTLNRKFPLVYFGTLESPGGPTEQRGIQHALAAQGPSDVVVPRISKASGPEARTVAEVHQQKDGLRDKAVVIQGQVVKVNNGIMGRNWVHLRDGSGAGPTADLTFTTRQQATVGEVVILRGVVRIEKDFGAGYRYPVIIEDGTITRPKRR
ncbi:MAG: nucleotide-binding protein [Acidobacteria bacterium]|nr:nucleotide-binding protein [Acidobacteriota bacterium]